MGNIINVSVKLIIIELNKNLYYFLHENIYFITYTTVNIHCSQLSYNVLLKIMF